MNKISLLLFVFLLLSNNRLASQSDDWQLPSKMRGMATKQDGNVMYIIDSTLYATEMGDMIIGQTKEYIAKNLNILHESEFNEPVIIMFIHDRHQMHKSLGKRNPSFIVEKGQNAPANSILCVYDSKHSSLNKELMNLMMTEKWGIQNDNQLVWLKEGLATYANPESVDCDGYTFEERYTFFLQNGKLLDVMQFPKEGVRPQYKIAGNQSAYIVQYLLENYGIEKLKELWRAKMTDFEKIYGQSFDNTTAKINKELSKKHSTPIQLDWESFTKDCIKPQYDDWLLVYNKYSNPKLEKMVTKEDGNLKFIVDSTMDMDKRNDVIIRTKEYIAENLALINEAEFNDSIRIVIMENKNQLEEILGFRMGGLFSYGKDGIPEQSEENNSIYAIDNGKHHSLKHELMHAITI